MDTCGFILESYLFCPACLIGLVDHLCSLRVWFKLSELHHSQEAQDNIVCLYLL